MKKQLTPAEFNKLAQRAEAQRRKTRLIGQSILMLAGFGLFFSAMYCSTQPQHADFERDFHLFALFGLLVGSFGFLNFYQDNK